MWTVEERIERPVAEVAELLHISEGALYAAMRLDDLRYVKRGEKGGRAVTTLAWVYEWQDASAAAASTTSATSCATEP